MSGGDPEPGAAGDASATPAGAATPTAAATADEALPEWEPLTPELVEEECLRGDFVMKWAVVLLAFLYGSTMVNETQTLVRVRTGQYIASHGFLPPATDPFSSTAADRRWVNLAWLFDLILAGVYGIGGWIGVSLLKASLSLLTFAFLVHIVRPGVSTWWGSVCAALAVLACQPRMTAQPEIVTLLGLASTWWMVHQWRLTGQTRLLWGIVPLFAVWANLDNRMFLGPLSLLLYGLGELIGARFASRPAFPSDAERKAYWTAVGLGLAAMLLHPFTYETWLAPWRLYGTIYPSVLQYATLSDPQPVFLQYFPVFDWPFLRATVMQGDHTAIAGLALFALAAGAMFLNASRVEIGHVVLFFGMAALGALKSHELGAASLVFAMIATLNGQTYYAISSYFKKEYSTAPLDLMFSRGGRAVTVLGLFAAALFMTTGKMQGRESARLGFGLDPQLDGAARSYQELLGETFEDDRPFHFQLNQGDLLIWIGKPSFVDNRIEIFAGKSRAAGDDNASGDLLALHRELRFAIAPKQQEGQEEDAVYDPAKWRPTLDRYRITSVIPRLSGGVPDYDTLIDLFVQPEEFAFCKIGSATAVFYRRGTGLRVVDDYVQQNRMNFIELAYRSPPSTITGRRSWVTFPGFYERYLWARDLSTTAETQEAMHLLMLAKLRQPGQLGEPSLAILAIRRAQEGLNKNRNDPLGYFVLGDAYVFLGDVEQRLRSGVFDTRIPVGITPLRYFQAVAALNQAVMADPQRGPAHLLLGQVYASHQRHDLELRELRAYADWLESREELSSRELEQVTLIDQRIDELEQLIAKVDEQMSGPDFAELRPSQRAFYYNQAGCLLAAQRLLESDMETVNRFPPALLLRLLLQLETGQVEEAYLESERLSGLFAQGGDDRWRDIHAFSKLANAEHLQAVESWNTYADNVLMQSTMKLMYEFSPRFTTENPEADWPVTQLQASSTALFEAMTTATNFRVSAGLVQMEAGYVKEAVETFERVLRDNPETTERGIVGYYLARLTGKSIDVFPPSEMLPILFGDDSEETPADEAPAGKTDPQNP